jgi:hypothetical protein
MIEASIAEDIAMTRTITAVAAAALVGATALATPKPAEARCWGCYAGAGVALGVVGGALLAANSYYYPRSYYYGYPGYSYPAYSGLYAAYSGYPAYGYGYAPYPYGVRNYGGTPTDINGNYLPTYGSYGYYQ